MWATLLRAAGARQVGLLRGVILGKARVQVGRCLVRFLAASILDRLAAAVHAVRDRLQRERDQEEAYVRQARGEVDEATVQA